jgi:hypothetical protein
MGSGNIVVGANSSAFGTGNVVNGAGSYAIRDPNTITGNNSFALGNNTITADNAVAIGSGNTLAQNNTVAIGQGVTTSRADQVAIGTAANTYTLPGLASAASLAAQVGPTNFITTDANGNLAASPFGTGSFASAGSVRPSPPPPRACRRGLALFSNTQSTADARRARASPAQWRWQQRRYLPLPGASLISPTARLSAASLRRALTGSTSPIRSRRQHC